ncbi:hypothetical protein B0H67DRAFT_5483 [Lasiosphaeris hirsuta]|uniref:Uncharacterized protein n=1 Tax=Lasiosphaeris hirsuta TaxID=260670 RepID=A0AA40EA45_9PEZI|nr:hypothetical protein B0H67DRAFT_5483 [Lasiosphaeris hirsuta]
MTGGRETDLPLLISATYDRCPPMVCMYPILEYLTTRSIPAPLQNLPGAFRHGRPLLQHLGPAHSRIMAGRPPVTVAAVAINSFRSPLLQSHLQLLDSADR